MYVYKDVKWHQENYVTVKNVRNLKEKDKTLVPRRAFRILVKDIYMGHPHLGCASRWLKQYLSLQRPIRWYPDLDSDASSVRSFCASS